jgi:N-acetylmuramoyl-L-alanine amidase/putative methionine-R-sulfoxide reductase with GAF domain
MSATPNNAGAGWGGPPAEVSPAGLGRTDDLADDPARDGGRNALQALLAFACIHQQAVQRRALKDSPSSLRASPALQTSPSFKEEEFALDEVLQLVAARAISITGADGVAIALAEENAIVCRASAGRIAPDPGIKLDPSAGFSGACLRSGQTVRCDDSDTDSRVNAQACRALGTRSMIAVPLSAKKRVVGLIEAFSTETSGFNDSDVRSLNLLGELILAAVRPEEEDRLAELAKKIVVPEPAPRPTHLASEAPAVTPHVPAKIIVDEKFAPPAVVTPVIVPPSMVPPVIAPLAPDPPVPVKASAVSDPASAIPTFAEPLLNPKPVPIEAPGSLPKEGRSLSSILLTAALVLVVIGLGWAVVWKARHVEQAISANTRPISSVKKTELNAPLAPDQTTPSPEVKAGAFPEVTGIRHWSSKDSSTVVVDLQDQVQYEAHSLDNPARIYFDLHDTKMAAGLMNQSIDVNDALLKRVRMAQPTDSVTRVVLETRRDSEFSVSLDPNPYRLTIQVRKPATNSAASVGVMASPATLSKPSPVVTVAPKKKANESRSNLPSLNPADFQVVLDAGHGGWDLGTVGRKGLLEKDLVLDIVQRLGKLVETKLGAQVIYTRADDSYLPLEKRAEIANVAKADLFLSVHANYSDLATARGVETYYTNTYSSVKARTSDDTASLKEVNWTGVDIREKVMDSHRLAADVQQALYGGLAARNPDLRNRGVKEAQYVVLTGTQMPAVLAEVSFVSSPADEDQLQSSAYRQQIAEALYKGVAKYREEITHTKVASAQKLVHR